MLRLCVVASLFASSLALCPSGFELARNGDCYKHLGDQFNYYAPSAVGNVVEACKEVGAAPVKIESQEDNDYWLRVAKADREDGKGSVNFGNVILGIICDTDNYWRWADGSHVDFRPDNYDPDLVERCDLNGQYCMWAIDPKEENWVKYCNIYRVVDVYCEMTPVHEVVDPDSDCGAFQYDEDDDVCYQLGVTSANYTEARMLCHSFGATLASIHSTRENSFVRRMAVSRGLVNGLLLGGLIQDSGTNQPIQWTDGTDGSFNNFAPGFPLDGFGKCLAMETNVASGQWINTDCATELPYACKRKTDRTAPECIAGLQPEGEVIYSPGFPGDASIPCDFLLLVDPGLVVEVEILLLEANTCCDRLVFFEGFLGGDVIADISGDDNFGVTIRTRSLNTMRVSWQPKGGVNVKGAMFTFRGVPKS